MVLIWSILTSSSFINAYSLKYSFSDFVCTCSTCSSCLYKSCTKNTVTPADTSQLVIISETYGVFFITNIPKLIKLNKIRHIYI